MAAPTVDINTVPAQQQFKNLRQQTRAVFQQMQILNKEFNRNIVLAQKLGFMLAGKLTPEERKVAAAAKSADSALLRQARVMDTAREKVLNLTQALKLSGATQQQQKFILRNVDRSLAALNKTMSAGVLTTRARQEAQARLNRTLGGAGRDLRVITAAQKKQGQAAAAAAAKNAGMTATLRNLGSSAIFAVGPLSGVGARINALGAIAVRTGVKIALLAAGIVALSVAFVKLISSSLRATLEFQKVISALTVATGSAFGAKDAFEFVSKTAIDLGLDLKSSATQFGQLAAAAKGTSLEGAQIRQIFLSTSKAAVALGLGVEQVTGIFRALQQMISKGTVQAEELRGQLGERLPGAFQIAAIAAGVTTKELGKMLEQGQVLADDLLPKLGEEFEKRFAKQAVIASKNLQAGINRLSSTTFLFSLNLDKTIKSSTAAASILDRLSRIVLNLSKNMVTLVAAIGGVAVGLAALAAPGIFAGLTKLASILRTVAITIFGLGTALAAGPAGLILVLARLVGGVALGAATFAVFKNSLDNTSASQAQLIQSLEEYIKVVKEAEGATEASINAQIRFAKIGIKSLQTEIKALSVVVQAEPKPLGARGMLARRRRLGIPTTDAEKQLQALSKELDVLLEKLGELEELPKISLGAGAAKEEITDLIKELQVLGKVKIALAKGDLIQARRIPIEEEAREIVREIPKKDLEQELARLGVSAVGLSDIEKFEALTRAITDSRVAIELLKKETKKTTKDLEAAPEAIKKLNAQVAALNKQSLALRSGPDAIRAFKAELREQKALKEYTKAVKVLGLANLALVPTFAEFKAAIESVRLDKLTAKANEQIDTLQDSNDVLRLRISGLKEEADILEIRNKLEREFGEELAPNVLAQLQKELEINKQLSDEFKKQKEAQKENAKLAKDFSKVIGTAFEDALVGGKGFRAILKGILDDINRIIIRTQITKPFTTFLEKQISGISEGGAESATKATGVSALPDFLRDTPPIPSRRPEGLTDTAQETASALDSTSRAADTLTGSNEVFAESLATTGESVTQAFSGALTPASLEAAASSGTQSIASRLLTGTLGVQTSAGQTLAGALVGLTTAANSAAAALNSIVGSTGGGGGGLLGGLFGGLFGGGGGGAGAIEAGGVLGPGTFVPGGFGIGFKHGGRPPVGRAVTVGEEGPETFVADRPGTIIPANSNVPASVTINQRFDFRGASLEAVALLRRESTRIRKETIAEVERRDIRGINAARR